MREQPVATVSRPRRPGRPPKDRAPASGTDLDAFFRSIAPHRVIAGDKAIELIRQIHRMEVEFWRHALSLPAAAGLVRKVAAATLASIDSEAEPLSETASPEQIRSADPDLRAHSAVLAAIEHVPAVLGPKRKFEEYQERLAQTAREIAKLRNKIMVGNLRLVVSVVRRFARHGFGLGELVQEGSLGLMKAIGRFEPDRGYKFATYASWWIKHGARRAIENHKGDVRIPSGRQSQRNRIRRAQWSAENKAMGEVSIAEIAAEAGISERAARAALHASGSTVSMDQPLSDDDDRSLEGLLSDQDQPSAFDVVAASSVGAELHALIERVLNPTEREVISMRMGLDGFEEHSLEDVGRRYGLSRERIRQIEVIALDKLRARLPRSWRWQ